MNADAMMESFEWIDPEEMPGNVFQMIGQDWMLIAAGGIGDYNMMTAAWGTAGILWKKPVAIAFVRPQRYTYEYLEKHAGFTLSFFPDSYKELLQLCGTRSGRDINKMALPELDAFQTPDGRVGFRQAKLILECRKIYYDNIDPAFFLSFDIEKNYPQKDYHRFYIGEIMKVWKARE